MIQIRIIMIAATLCVTTYANCQIKNDKEKLRLNDPIAVKSFITTTTVCDRLKYVGENPILFISDGLYSGLILKSITKETGMPLFLVISNGGVIEPEKHLINKLEDQIIQIREIVGCKNSKLR